MGVVAMYRKCSTEADCVAQLEEMRWNGIPICPYCSSTRTTPAKGTHRHHCNGCNVSFSVTVNTIFHRSHLPLQIWFLALPLVLDEKANIVICRIAKHLGINKNSAWSLVMRIRGAMMEPTQRELLLGIISRTALPELGANSDE